MMSGKKPTPLATKTFDVGKRDEALPRCRVWFQLEIHGDPLYVNCFKIVGSPCEKLPKLSTFIDKGISNHASIPHRKEASVAYGDTNNVLGGNRVARGTLGGPNEICSLMGASAPPLQTTTFRS
jgi:hypothetical protein